MTWNIIGHEWAVQLLRGHIKNNSLRHAYLFTGPHGIGKKNLAVRFIQAINCPNGIKDANPCLACSTCKRLGRMEHPDLFPVTLEEDNSKIKVDQIRELIRSLSLSPYEAKRRFGLLIDFETANASAQNSLLKTLEEPPGSVVLVLTAVSSDSLLETITSRCEEIKLNTVPISDTIQGLENLHHIQSDQADFLAHISGGRPEIALQYHLDPESLERRNNLLDDHLQMIQSNSVERFFYANLKTKDPQLIEEILDTWISLWHDILHQSGKSEV
ncbi:MAG: hypothetical protein MUO54_14985, partial [Anaerolineales bacterium]|nr:hypothetical protein [Anaerolineales bacterium]